VTAEMIPQTFVTTVADAFERILNVGGEYRIFRRPVSMTDPSRSIGVFADHWMASPEDKLIGARNREPFQSTYRIFIQNIVIHGDTEVGRAIHSLDSKSIRAILYRDTALHVALAGQTEIFMGSTERVLKYDVLRQEYGTTRSTVGFLYLAKTEFSITTETTQ
jgi:hypothetical protein